MNCSEIDPNLILRTTEKRKREAVKNESSSSKEISREKRSRFVSVKVSSNCSSNISMLIERLPPETENPRGGTEAESDSQTVQHGAADSNNRVDQVPTAAESETVIRHRVRHSEKEVCSYLKKQAVQKEVGELRKDVVNYNNKMSVQNLAKVWGVGQTGFLRVKKEEEYTPEYTPVKKGQDF